MKSRRLAVRVKAPGLPDNGRAMTRPTQMLADENASSEAAEVPELLGRPDLLVTRHLEDRVARGVEDGPACREVLGAQRSDDLGSRGRHVAENLLARIALEGQHHLGRETARIQRERPLRDETHHLPMAGCRVLACRDLESAAPTARSGSAARGREQGKQSEPLQIRERRRVPVEHVAEGVAARVAVTSRVGRGPDAEAVTNDDNDASRHEN